LKLIDFGLGNLYGEGEKLKTACGSPCYAAPEIISGLDYDPISVDVWSSGITLYCMTVGCLPFDEETKTQLYSKILSCSYSLPKSMSGEGANLIKKILVRDPKLRYRLDDIKKHPWFKMYQPMQLHDGIIAGVHEIHINKLVCKLAAEMQGIEFKAMWQMLVENDHNKYTTLYFLLIKKAPKYEKIAIEKGLAGDDDPLGNDSIVKSVIKGDPMSRGPSLEKPEVKNEPKVTNDSKAGARKVSDRVEPSEAPKITTEGLERRRQMMNPIVQRQKSIDKGSVGSKSRDPSIDSTKSKPKERKSQGGEPRGPSKNQYFAARGYFANATSKDKKITTEDYIQDSGRPSGNYPDSPKINDVNLRHNSPDQNFNQNLTEDMKRRGTGASINPNDVLMNQIMLSQTSKNNERTDKT
jgi:serine/threonine protein kinase